MGNGQDAAAARFLAQHQLDHLSFEQGERLKYPQSPFAPLQVEHHRQAGRSGGIESLQPL